jgi:hypothetical protein
MATESVSETDTVEAMIYASAEFAANLAHLRDKWVRIDPALAKLIEGLRIQFAAFAEAASSGLIADPGTLHTIGRIYNEAAGAVHELAEASSARHPTEGREARAAIARASGLSVLVCDLIEKGPRSIIRKPN